MLARGSKCVLWFLSLHHVGSAPVLVELGGQVGGTMHFRLSRTASANPRMSDLRMLVCYDASWGREHLRAPCDSNKRVRATPVVRAAYT